MAIWNLIYPSSWYLQYTSLLAIAASKGLQSQLLFRVSLNLSAIIFHLMESFPWLEVCGRLILWCVGNWGGILDTFYLWVATTHKILSKRQNQIYSHQLLNEMQFVFHWLWQLTEQMLDMGILFDNAISTGFFSLPRVNVTY